MLSSVHKTSTTRIRPTQIKMKRISPVSTYSLVVRTSPKYQPKPICLKGNYIVVVYDKTWYTGIVQDVDQEQMDASI